MCEPGLQYYLFRKKKAGGGMGELSRGGRTDF